MSIYVAVTRFREFGEDDGMGISLDEWLRLADALPDFRKPLATEEGMGMQERMWTGGHVPWPFCWSDGQVEVKSPDQKVLVRMIELAALLRARVVSETGETFNDDGTHAGFEEWA